MQNHFEFRNKRERIKVTESCHKNIVNAMLQLTGPKRTVELINK